jgi:rSAM/selenodomain-associated transferase 2
MISIIIPTVNEAQKIGDTISLLQTGHDAKFIKEIIIADGASNDNTVDIAKNKSAKILQMTVRNRAAQLNGGAAIAQGDILFFLHADSLPCEGFSTKIIEAVSNHRYAGCLRLSFDYSHWFLKTNAWFTRFNVNALRFGDQGLFVTRDVFEKSKRYNENLFVMEDQEIIHRIKKISSFTVLNTYITTSARKYLQHGIYKTQAIFFVIWFLYYLGVSQNRLLNIHRKAFKKPSK